MYSKLIWGLGSDCCAQAVPQSQRFALKAINFPCKSLSHLASHFSKLARNLPVREAPPHLRSSYLPYTAHPLKYFFSSSGEFYVVRVKPSTDAKPWWPSFFVVVCFKNGGTLTRRCNEAQSHF